VLIAGAELAASQGDFKLVADQIEQLEAAAAAFEGPVEKHNVLLLAALAKASRGEQGGAVAQLAEAEELLPEDRTAAVERTKVRVLVDRLTGDSRSAAVHGEMAIDMARDAGVAHEVMFNLLTLGEVLVDAGESARAYGAIRQALELCEEYGYERFANYGRMLLAYLEGLQGAVDADKLLAQGIGYADAKEFSSEVIVGRLLLAKLLRGQGRPEQAALEYERVRALAARTGRKGAVDECERALEALGKEGPSAEGTGAASSK
jgi:tetratricopeptide (TPR) repeat protein